MWIEAVATGAGVEKTVWWHVQSGKWYVTPIHESVAEKMRPRLLCLGYLDQPVKLLTEPVRWSMNTDDEFDVHEAQRRMKVATVDGNRRARAQSSHIDNGQQDGGSDWDADGDNDEIEAKREHVWANCVSCNHEYASRWDVYGWEYPMDEQHLPPEPPMHADGAYYCHKCGARVCKGPLDHAAGDFRYRRKEGRMRRNDKKRM